MPSFMIYTLGCKVNTYESECYYQALINKGYFYNENKADIYIINTCAVTNTAASKSRQKIHFVQKENNEAFICVVGCLAQIDSLENEKIDLLIGAKHKDKLADLIDELYQSKQKKSYVEDISKKFDFEDLKLNHYENQTRAFLKIEDGCNQFCSYCTIPLTRGRERSLNFERVIDIAKDLVNNNHKEIVLTGIHTGRYQDKNYTLVDVCKELCKLDLERIRISSIEITEITNELIDLIKNNEKMAKHLHIPLQAGSDKILKLMNRPYTKEYFINRINFIRSQIPNIAIGTDIIVGFCEEDDNDYLETKKIVNLANLNYLHVFPYSIRKNTKAALNPSQISSEIKKARVKDLIALGKSQKEYYLKEHENKIVKVLFENQKNGYYFGHTSDYCEVRVISEIDLCSKMYNTIIKEAKADYLIGEIDDHK